MTTADEVTWYYNTVFRVEYMEAKQEYDRLCQLLHDVLWFNFEVDARVWVAPWPRTDLDSTVSLYAPLYSRKRKRDGFHLRYTAWYDGPVRDAEVCPIAIVVKEVKAAKAYMNACEKQLNAADDWAPGGCEYEQLRRITLVGR